MEILIIVGIVLLSVFISCLIIARQLSQHNFKCKSCLKSFKPEWKKLIFITHSDDEYNIKCPYCNNKGCFLERNKT